MRNNFLPVVLVVICAVGALSVHAYDPGDVNGDGVVDAEDLSCATTTVFDPNDGCAVATTAPLEHVITVSPSGGDFTSIQAALDSIPLPTVGRWLIRVGPGDYVERVTMRANVAIEGAGEGLTSVAQNGSVDADTGTVIGADDAELRHITVYNHGGANAAIGVFCDGVEPSLAHVTIQTNNGLQTTAGLYLLNDAGPETTAVHAWASSPTGKTYGLYFEGSSSPQDTDIEGLDAEASYGVEAVGIFCADGILRISGVTANGSNGAAGSFGLSTEDCTVSVLRSTIIGEGGNTPRGIQITNTDSSKGGRLDVANSEIIGADATVFESGDGSAFVGGSLLMGGPVAGEVQCAGVWDGDYTFYASSCPTGSK